MNLAAVRRAYLVPFCRQNGRGVVVVVVLTLTRITKSVVTGQAP